MNLQENLQGILMRICSDVNYPQNECTESLSEYEIHTNTLLEKYNNLSSTDREIEANRMDISCAGLLLAHAQNIATYVMNHSNEGQMLKTALIALSLAARTVDFRDITVILSLIFDSASRVGVDLLSLASESECSVLDLRSFSARPPEDKSIECMGYTIQYKNGKPYYFRNW